MSGKIQQNLFGEPEPSRRKSSVEPAAVDASDRAIADRIPGPIRFGTSSWSFPGWEGLVYAKKHSPTLLSRHGLAAYAQHPLLRTVGLDRTHYAPMSRSDLAEYADQVPDDFRFLVKGHEWCTLARFPSHPRYGARGGEENPHFLDADYAAAEVVDPVVEGLGPKLGLLLFQIAPQSFQSIGGERRFLDRLHGFLTELPKGPTYAIELRNRELITPDYRALLQETGTLHCLNAMGRMPSLPEQWEATGAVAGSALVVRWMLHPALHYESAVKRYEPFHEIVDEDVETRVTIARLIGGAVDVGQPVFVVVNNKAEGSSPRSVTRLARAVVTELETGDPHEPRT